MIYITILIGFVGSAVSAYRWARQYNKMQIVRKSNGINTLKASTMPDHHPTTNSGGRAYTTSILMLEVTRNNHRQRCTNRLPRLVPVTDIQCKLQIRASAKGIPRKCRVILLPASVFTWLSDRCGRTVFPSVAVRPCCGLHTMYLV